MVAVDGIAEGSSGKLMNEAATFYFAGLSHYLRTPVELAIVVAVASINAEVAALEAAGAVPAFLFV